MSLLDNLIEFSNFKQGSERASSLSLRTRLGQDEGEEGATEKHVSKSLSKPIKTKKKDPLSQANLTATGKALYKLTYIINRKLKTIRYFFFVKLETLKKLNLKIEKEETDEELPPTASTLPSPTKGEQPVQSGNSAGSNIQQSTPSAKSTPDKDFKAKTMQRLESFRDSFELLYLKNFGCKVQADVFKKLQKCALYRKRLAEFAKTTGRVLEGWAKWMQKDVFEMWKQRERQFLRTDLFVDIASSYANRQCLQLLRQAFQTIQNHSPPAEVLQTSLQIQRRQLAELEAQYQRLEKERTENQRIERERFEQKMKEDEIERERKIKEIQEQRRLKEIEQAKRLKEMEDRMRREMQDRIQSQAKIEDERRLQEQEDNRKFNQMQKTQIQTEQQEKAKSQIQQKQKENERAQVRQKRFEQLKLTHEKIQQEKRKIEQQQQRQKARVEQQKKVTIDKEKAEQQKKRKNRFQQQQKALVKKRSEEQTRIRERLLQEKRVKQRLQQQLRTRQKLQQELRVKQRLQQDIRSRQQQKCKQRVIDQDPNTRFSVKYEPKIPTNDYNFENRRTSQDLRTKFYDEKATPRDTGKTEPLSSRSPQYTQKTGQKIEFTEKKPIRKDHEASSKKKIILSKRMSVDDGSEAKRMDIPARQLEFFKFAACQLATKIADAPIQGNFSKMETMPKAIYRHYPDQISKEIEDIPDNLKLFMENQDFRPDNTSILALSDLKSFNDSMTVVSAKYDNNSRVTGGLQSQMDRIREQQSFQKTVKLENPAKFTSPPQFFRTSEPLRFETATYSRELPGRDPQHSSPYPKQKVSMGHNSDSKTGELYVSRKIKQACMDGNQKEEYGEWQTNSQYRNRRMGSETKIIRLPEPPTRLHFEKSSSSDAKFKPVQLIKMTSNTSASTTPPQSLTPAETPTATYLRRPNSECPGFQQYRKTFDLKPPSSQPTVNLNAIGQYFGEQPAQMGNSSQPTFFQSQYYFNRSKMLAATTAPQAYPI